MDDDDRAKPDHAGGSKHKVTLNLDKAVWQELENAAETEGIEPKELIVRLVTEHLGSETPPVDASV
jgi:predicted DNA-binding ribbon-helix-helix protein